MNEADTRQKFVLQRLPAGRWVNVIMEIQGFGGKDAKEKANTVCTWCVPGVNNLGGFGRWAFAEFLSVFEIRAEFDKLSKSATGGGGKGFLDLDKTPPTE